MRLSSNIAFVVIVVSAAAVVVVVSSLHLQLSLSPKGVSVLPRLPLVLVHRRDVLSTRRARNPTLPLFTSIAGNDDQFVVSTANNPQSSLASFASTISNHVRDASIAQSTDDKLTQQYEMENAERALAAWVEQYRIGRRGGSTAATTATTSTLDEAGGVGLPPAPDAEIFDMVIRGVLELSSPLAPGIATVTEAEATLDDSVDDNISNTNEMSTMSKSDRATTILDLMESFHEPTGLLYDAVIASHAKDALEYLSYVTMERHREVQMSNLKADNNAEDEDEDHDSKSRFSPRYHRQQMAWKSAKSALQLLNRSEELYYETGQVSSRLPSISSYIVVMDVWKALAVSGVKDANEELDDEEQLEGRDEDWMKRKRDEAMEVVRNLRQRRLRVYNPRTNDDDNNLSNSGSDDGRLSTGGNKSTGGYNILPPAEVVASMMTVNDVLEFGVNLLRESVPSYQLQRPNDEDAQPGKVGTWHFNQLIFDLAKYPQPYSGPLAQDLLDYMVYTVRKQHRRRKGGGSKKKMEVQSAIVPKPNSETINGVLKAWMVTPTTYYSDVARRAEAVLAKLAIWQSEGMLWGVSADTVSYNTCINIWKKSVDIPGAAQRATDILLLMEDESTSVTPDVISYATCIGAWADCASHVSGAGKCAEEILMRMYNRCKNVVGDESAAPSPTARCFNAVLLAYANGRQSGSGKRALDLLRFMERLHSEGYKDLSPDKYTFNIVMKALANCGERGAAHKANQLLQRMEASFANGDSSLKPDLLSYNTVLDAFSKEGDAKSADRLLEQMLGKGDDTIRPDAYSYTAVLTAWSKSDDRAMAVKRAEDLFKDIESKYADGETDFHADTSVYNALINCWAKSGEGKAIYRVTQILSLMEELGLQGGDSDVQPNSRTYCAVLDTLARSKSYKACAMSLEILQRMHDFYAEGHDSVRPCVRAYSIVLSIIARSRRKDKAVKAQELLHRMESEYRSGNTSCRPNVYSYNAVLNAAAFSGRDEREQEDAFRVACSTFDELRMSDYLAPSDISYGAFLKAIKHLMPESEVRANLVKGVFRKCCRDGLTSDFVLKEMSDLATPELYQSLLKGVANDYGNLPKSWSANVRGKSLAMQR